MNQSAWFRPHILQAANFLSSFPFCNYTLILGLLIFMTGSCLNLSTCLTVIIWLGFFNRKPLIAFHKAVVALSTEYSLDGAVLVENDGAWCRSLIADFHSSFPFHLHFDSCLFHLCAGWEPELKWVSDNLF